MNLLFLMFLLGLLAGILLSVLVAIKRGDRAWRKSSSRS